MKWTTTAGPRQTKKAEEALKALDRMKAMVTEVTGIVGGEENRNTVWILGGFGVPANESWQKAWTDLGEKFDWTITAGNYARIIEEAKEACRKVVVPERDKRRTPEQIEQANQLVKQAQDKRDQETQAFRAAHCLPKPVAVPPGQMTLILQMTYDNSDTMTDYFDPHARYGPPMLLAILCETAHRSEALARSVVGRYPTLAVLEWTWHVEDHRGGNGAYLQSQWLEEMAPRQTQAGTQNPPLRYEVKFDRLSSAMYDAWREYPGTIAEAGADPSEAAQADNPVPQIRENEKLDGIEIRFACRPNDDTLAKLKSHGWRWTKTSHCWYKRRSEEAKQFAESLVGKVA